MTEHSLVGAWKLIDAEFRLESGAVLNPFGTHPLGVVLFTADGHFSVQIIRTQKLPESIKPPRKDTPEIFRAALDGNLAYAGSYAYSRGTLKSHILISSISSWIGEDHVRHCEFTEDGRLHVITNPISSMGTSLTVTLTLERI